MDELTLPLLPLPETIERTGGTIHLPLRMTVSGIDPERIARVWKPLRWFAETLQPGMELRPAAEGDRSAMLRVQQDSAFAGEAYSLSSHSTGLTLRASTDSGLFRGLTTLLQLLAGAERSGETLTLPALQLTDRPRFGWRGMHLDVARHWFPVDVIQHDLDLLALHRINVFHWHLTDDQGWRIEVPSRPELTDIGGWRTDADGTRSGGFYTRDDIREVVDYAAERFITVLPEIELPGHVRAALAAHPELSCTGIPHPVPSTWGIFEDVYCAGNDAVFELLADVFDEVCTLFPGEFVHIGGDECPTTRWRDCPKCRERMRREGLSSVDQLQPWVVRRVQRMLAERGKRLIGWDEILNGGLDRDAAVMAWRSTERGLEAARAGHDVVMAPTAHCYFDYAQAEHGEPEAFPSVLTLEQVYAFDPAPVEWPEDARSKVLGGQANLWTERIDSESHMQYMLLPRLCALAERLWTRPQSRAAVDIHHRLSLWLDLLRKLGVNSRPFDGTPLH